MRFQHNLDGSVIVESGAGLYVDSRANFEADSGAALVVVPGFVFVPGVVNKISDGESDGPGVEDDAPYSAHIASVAALLAAKLARESAAAAAAAAAYGATQAGINAKAKAALLALDLSSIRALREYIAAKPDAPQALKDKEAAAAAERGKIK